MDDQPLDTATIDVNGPANASNASGAATSLTDEQHDWASNFCGINTRAEAETGGDSSSTGTSARGNGGDSSNSGLLGALSSAAGAVSDAASGALSAAESAVSCASSAISQVDAREETGPAQPPASTDDLEKVGGSSTGVLDTLGSMASGVGSALSGAASTALDAANAAGKSVASAESAVLGGAKTAYTAVTGAYDSVAPDFTKSNQELGSLVDAGEAAAKKVNDKAAADYADVPVLGSLMKGSSALATAGVDAAGGVVKGVGDLATGAANAFVHPIDSAASLAQGALGVAEHVPIAPGLNTTVKAIHGAVDLVSGNTAGEYGSNLSDLGKNLVLDTQQDPNDPSKQTNTDVNFAASFGGGTKAWINNPVDAAARTITDLAPAALGDEAAGGDQPPSSGDPPGPDAPVRKTVDLGKTQPDLGKTLPGGDQPLPSNAGPPSGGDPPPPNTVDLGKTQPNAPGYAPQTEGDPANPGPEPDASETDPAAALEQAKQNLTRAKSAWKAASDADMNALQEWIRYHQNMPDPVTRKPYGAEGDPSKWDPDVERALENQYELADQATMKALNDVRAAEEAVSDAESRARRARSPLATTMTSAPGQGSG